MIKNILLKLIQPLTKKLIASDKFQKFLAKWFDVFKMKSPKIAIIVYGVLIGVIAVAEQAIEQKWLDSSYFWVAQGLQLISMIAGFLFNPSTYQYKIEENKVEENSSMEQFELNLEKAIKEKIEKEITSNDNSIQQPEQ